MLANLKKQPRKVFLASAMLALAFSTLLYLVIIRDKSPPTKEQTGLTTADGQKVNLEPPTEEEKSEANSRKGAIVKRDEEIKNPPSGSAQINPATIVITESSSTIVRAYVSGVFEEGGTCTATATQNSQVITKSSVGFQNVSYTQCAPMQWDTALGAGTWTIKVSYKSPTTEVSQTRTIEV